jgi:hypothetical protein
VQRPGGAIAAIEISVDVERGAQALRVTHCIYEQRKRARRAVKLFADRFGDRELKPIIGRVAGEIFELDEAYTL